MAVTLGYIPAGHEVSTYVMSMVIRVMPNEVPGSAKQASSLPVWWKFLSIKE